MVRVYLHFMHCPAAGGTKALDLGANCHFPSGVIYAAPSGHCAVTPGSNAATDDRSKVNLMELNINAADGKDNYDLSAKASTTTFSESVSALELVAADCRLILLLAST
jgi:hypothetical protein